MRMKEVTDFLQAMLGVNRKVTPEQVVPVDDPTSITNQELEALRKRIRFVELLEKAAEYNPRTHTRDGVVLIEPDNNIAYLTDYPSFVSRMVLSDQDHSIYKQGAD